MHRKADILTMRFSLYSISINHAFSDPNLIEIHFFILRRIVFTKLAKIMIRDILYETFSSSLLRLVVASKNIA